MPKILQVPDFVEGQQYRQLHPTKEGDRRWRFVLLKDVTVRLDAIDNKSQKFSELFLGYDDLGIHRCTIARSSLTVHKGYAWNGCTPKRWFPLLGWVGTPDFEGTRIASCFHDSLYQFGQHDGFPFTRAESDDIFRQLMGAKGLRVLKSIYYRAVRWFGSYPDPEKAKPVKKKRRLGPRHR